MKLVKALIAIAAIGVGSQAFGKATLLEEVAQKRKDIAVKLTPEQVTEVLENTLIGDWTVVDKESKAVIHKWNGRWNERGLSVKGTGVDFDNGKIKNVPAISEKLQSIYEDFEGNLYREHCQYD